MCIIRSLGAILTKFTFTDHFCHFCKRNLVGSYVHLLPFRSSIEDWLNEERFFTAFGLFIWRCSLTLISWRIFFFFCLSNFFIWTNTNKYLAFPQAFSIMSETNHYTNIITVPPKLSRILAAMAEEVQRLHHEHCTSTYSSSKNTVHVFFFIRNQIFRPAFTFLEFWVVFSLEVS